MNKQIFFLSVFLILTCPFNSNGYGPKKTHPIINGYAIKLSGFDAYLKANLNMSEGINELFQELSVKEWFEEGGKDEDKPGTRGLYHFHDPTKAWKDAGLFGSYSALLWAQDITWIAFPAEFEPDTMNPEWSWPAARKNYYTALTTENKITRDRAFGKAFKGVGHVMHLLSDMAVPEHVRNDQHVLSSKYENWVEINLKEKLVPFIDTHKAEFSAVDYSITGRSSQAGIIPISNFWDVVPYATPVIDYVPYGLAEYTNRNFVSEDTIFKHYAYPEKTTTFQCRPVTAKDGKSDNRCYYQSQTTDGKTVKYLASAGFFWSELTAVQNNP
jgi:hypothetical protein